MLQLKDLLRRKGMTAKELAVKIGISEGALSKSLSGNPTLERIEQIAAALGVSVPELLPSTNKHNHLPEMRDGAGGKGTGIASDCLPLGWGSLYKIFTFFVDISK